MNEKTYRDLLPVIIKRVGAVLSEGFDAWGLKSVYSDLTTTNDFQWAAPGGRSRSDNAVVPENKRAFPYRRGDGLCVGTTWSGMASDGITAHVLLLVAYRSDYVLGTDQVGGKLRVRGEVAVVAIVDGWRLLREAGARADLRGADLRGADLSDADLYSADLSGADLYNADLYNADLRDADLTGANLTGADLRDAKLRHANPRGADLFDADLRGADLSDADLRHADLRYADLTGADLSGADLSGAILTGSNLICADLTGANLSDAILWGADLRDAILACADLYGAELTGAVNVSLPGGWKLSQRGIAERTHDTTEVTR